MVLKSNKQVQAVAAALERLARDPEERARLARLAGNGAPMPGGSRVMMPAVQRGP